MSPANRGQPDGLAAASVGGAEAAAPSAARLLGTRLALAALVIAAIAAIALWQRREHQVALEAARLEAEGHRILKLNIGNPAPFGFETPDTILQDIIANLPLAEGYSDSKGILSARRAVVTRYEDVEGFPRLSVDDVYLGNGVSELITMTMQALPKTRKVP